MQDTKYKKWHGLIGLISILIFAGIIRLYHIDNHGIWLDEKATIRAAVGIRDYKPLEKLLRYQPLPANFPFIEDIKLNKPVFTAADYWAKNTVPNVINATINDNGNSLSCNLSLHYWINIFGPTDFSARIFSTLFNLLTIITCYFFGVRFFRDARYALILAALMAVNSWLVIDSQLVRTYSFTTFFTFCSTFALFCIVFEKRNNWWLYIIYSFTSLVAIFGHHLAIYIFISQALIILLFFRDKKTYLLLLLAALPSILLFFLWSNVWAVQGFELLKWKSIGFAEEAKHYPAAKFPGVATPKNIFGGVINYLNMIMGADWLGYGLRIYMTLLMLFIPFGLVGIVFFKGANSLDKKLIISFLIIIISSPILCAYMAFKGHSAASMGIYYVSYALPAGAIILVLCWSNIAKLTGQFKLISYALIAAQVIFIAISLPKAYGRLLEDAPMPNPYTYQVANKVVAQYQQGDTIIYPRWEDAQMTNLYLKGHDEILQKVDTTLNNVIIIKRGEGQILLLDFKTGKFRY